MKQPLRVAIVHPGDEEVRRLATPQNNRFADLFAASAANGVDASPPSIAGVRPTSCEPSCCSSTARWCGPTRSTTASQGTSFDGLLREVAAAGVFVSTHPDVILKIGTKDVLADTRETGRRSDVYRVDTSAQL